MARGNDALTRIADWSGASGLDLRHDAATGMGAVFSRCGRWRYLLWRVGPRGGRMLGIGLLNPSTADEQGDDPTIRQCRRRAAQARMTGILVWNLFAWRATLPAELKRAPDPVGAHNDAAIALALELCPRTLIGWGNHGSMSGRDRRVLAECSQAGAVLATLGFTGNGAPRHPLYVASRTRLRRWRPDSPCIEP